MCSALFLSPWDGQVVEYRGNYEIWTICLDRFSLLSAESESGKCSYMFRADGWPIFCRKFGSDCSLRALYLEPELLADRKKKRRDYLEWTIYLVSRLVFWKVGEIAMCRTIVDVTGVVFWQNIFHLPFPKTGRQCIKVHAWFPSDLQHVEWTERVRSKVTTSILL